MSEFKKPIRDESAEPTKPTLYDLPGPTFGGKQFWTDQLHRQQWRIQKNAVTGHHRLLDPTNVRCTWGTFDECERFLNQRVDPLADTGTVVLLLHGLMRSRNSLRGIAKYLDQKEDDFTVANVEYASTRDTLLGHAQALRSILEGFPNASSFHFVGHSLGNLVVRRMLKLVDDESEDRLIQRFGRMVMLGAPNNGAEFAQRFKWNPLFKAIWGKSGNQLGVGWEQAVSHLATPSFEFGIIAGSAPLTNPLLSGESDLVVSVAETRLVGAQDFLIVPTTHTFVMNHDQTMKATLNFLRSGSFRASGETFPIKSIDLEENESRLARGL